MPITRAMLAEVKDHGYMPELIPSAEFCSPLATNMSMIMDIPKTPAGMLTTIHDVYADRNDDADLRLKANVHEVSCRAAAIPDWTAPTHFDLMATDEKPIRVAVYARANLADYPVCHGVYAWMATIADKLAMKMPLTEVEKALDEKYGITGTFQRGTLPIKPARYYLYEYMPIFRETKVLRETVPVAGIELDRISPCWTGESFVALESVSMEHSAGANNTRMAICRDEDGSRDSPFIELSATALTIDFDLPMFIPALRELRMYAETDVQKDNYELRYTYCHYHLTNILRARWNIVPRESLPDELWDKVRCGVV